MRIAALVATSLALLPGAAPRQVLFFDAQLTQSGTGGPRGNKVGHVDSASGVLRDAAGRLVGRFSSTCVFLRILGKGVALERCAGKGETAEGRLLYVGAFRNDRPTAVATITGGSGDDRGARGTVAIRAISDKESLVTVTVTPRVGVTAHVGAIPRPAANTRFRRRADSVCAAATRRFAALPPFPFPHFDPLHPDPKLLPKVGRFLTGPRDARPILRRLNRQLAALGRPPADRRVWSRFLSARRATLAIQVAQDRAALARDVDAFVASVGDGDGASRRAAIAATVFGAAGCVP